MMVNKNKLAAFQFLAATVLLLIITVSSAQGQPVDDANRLKIKLGIATWAGFGNGIIGMNKGFFPNLNIVTLTLDDARARQAAFVSNDIDVMISSVDLFSQESAKGISGKAFLITCCQKKYTKH